MTTAPVPSLTDEALSAVGRTFALGWLEQRALVAAGRWRDAASASGASTPAQQHTWRERWERLNGPVVEPLADAV